ncbi:MAG: hypothetical protein R3A52_22360 [Polyangiales bacterium]
MIALGLIGHPVAHSRSPAMMRAALDAMGLAGTYTAFDVAPESLGDAVRAMGALGFAGANVTLPHKVAVMEWLVEVEPSARRAGAVNTLARAEGGYVGINTDVEGLAAALAEGGVTVRDADAVVLGAGGAARAAVATLWLGGARSVTVIARDGAKADALAGRAWGDARVRGAAAGSAQAREALGAMDVVVQCTPCGMDGGPAAEGAIALSPAAWCRAGARAMELVYAPRETGWTRAMRGAGLAVVEGGGLAMLAAQGAAALSRWTGRAAPVDVMRAALEVDVRGGGA